MNTPSRGRSATQQQFVINSKYVQSMMSLDDIRKLWNLSGLGNTAKLTTVKRWLNIGPATKNKKFEPFITNLALVGKPKKVCTLADKIVKLEKALTRGTFVYSKQKAMAASLVAFFTYDENLSHNQLQLVDSLIKM